MRRIGIPCAAVAAALLFAAPASASDTLTDVQVDQLAQVYQQELALSSQLALLVPEADARLAMNQGDEELDKVARRYWRRGYYRPYYRSYYRPYRSYYRPYRSYYRGYGYPYGGYRGGGFYYGGPGFRIGIGF